MALRSIVEAGVLVALSFPAMAQSAFDEYAHLKATELYDDDCHHMRATERAALDILLVDAYARADLESDLDDYMMDASPDNFMSYMEFLSALNAAAEALVPAACDSDPSGVYQSVYVNTVRFNFALFLLADFRDGLPGHEPFARTISPAEREIMEAYIGVLYEIFGADNFQILQTEAGALGQNIVNQQAGGVISGEEIDAWQDKVLSTLTAEVAIETAGYRARAVYYYGSTKMALLDTENQLVALGTHWPRGYAIGSADAVMGLVAALPDKSLRFYLLDARALDNPPAVEAYLYAGSAPSGMVLHDVFSQPDWRAVATAYPLSRLPDADCVGGPCYEFAPQLLAALGNGDGVMEMVLSSGPGEASEPDLDNVLYAAPIVSAIEDILSRYE